MKTMKTIRDYEPLMDELAAVRARIEATPRVWPDRAYRLPDADTEARLLRTTRTPSGRLRRYRIDTGEFVWFVNLNPQTEPTVWMP